MRAIVSQFTLAAAAGPAFARALNVLTRRLTKIRNDIVEQTSEPAMIHDYRVTLRQLRSVYRASGRLRPYGIRDFIRAEFKWLSSLSSEVRDIDVLLVALPDYAELIELHDRSILMSTLYEYLVRHGQFTRDAFRAALQSNRYIKFIHEWRNMVRDVGRKEPLGGSLAPRVAKEIRRLNTSLTNRKARHPESTVLHKLRKKSKRLRYILLTFRSLYTSIDISLEQLSSLQNALGEYCDIDVHTRLVPELLRSDAVHCDPFSLLSIKNSLEAQREKYLAHALSALTRFQHEWTLPRLRDLRKAG